MKVNILEHHHVIYEGKHVPRVVVKRGSTWPVTFFAGVFTFILLFMLCWRFTFNDKSFPPDPNYPTHTITCIVPIAAGGAWDLIGRSMEKFGMVYFKQPLVVTNLVGGSGMIGWNELARAKPDGYTIGLVSATTLLQQHYGKTRYQYSSALEPIIQIASMPMLIVVRSDRPWDNINDLIKYAKEYPGELKFGHTGLGTVGHVTGEMLNEKAGIKISQVPFNGDSETLAALLGGHVQVIIAGLSSINEYVKIGGVKVLATSSAHRITNPIYKDVPTLQEQGVDVVFEQWCGIAVPKIMNKDTRWILERNLVAIVHDPEFREHMRNLGVDVDYLNSYSFREKWLKEAEEYGLMVQRTGIAEIVNNQRN
jgi:tripartite-type tricarboxylate transporter receptor subunit TctC